MPQEIVLSINELHALLNRYFEAAFGHELDFYDAARTVLWLEAHDANGIEMLIGSLSSCRRNVPVFSTSGGCEFTVDVGDANGFAATLGTRDLVSAMAMQDECGYAAAHIINHDCPRMLMASVAELGAAQQNAFALWKSFGEERVHFSIASAGDEAPTYFAGVGEALISLREGEGHLYCLPNDENIDELVAHSLGAPLKKSGLERITSQCEFSESYRRAVNNGVAISFEHYSQICALADKIFVESSDASRRDAGD